MPQPVPMSRARSTGSRITALASVDVVPTEFDEPGWIAILEAEDHLGQPVLLVHRDDDRLRQMSVLDVVINNADRKGGHVLVAERTGASSAATTGSRSTPRRSCARCSGAGPTSRCGRSTWRCWTCSRRPSTPDSDDELASLITGAEIAALRHARRRCSARSA